MPGGNLEPILPAPNLLGVPADMSRIFARAGAPEAVVGPPNTARVSALRPGRTGGRGVTVLAAAVAGLAGLGTGAFVIHAQAPATPPPVAVVQPPPQAPAPAAVTTADPPLMIAPVPVRAAPPAPRPKPITAQPASCQTNTVGSSCRRAVIQADRHLRDVYQRAVRRGVPRAVLVDYRDRWADLRQDATDNPAHLIRGYGALASDLGREGRGDPQRRNPSELKALTSALTSWW